MGPDDDPGSSSMSARGRARGTNRSQAAPVVTKFDHITSSITKLKDPLDDTNWITWRERIRRIFHMCHVEPYVYGELKCPDPATDPELFDIWDANDVYAQILITNNISKEQMVHVTCLDTAYDIWKSLEAMHETKDYQIAIAIQRNLFGLRASDGDDIVEHLTQLKKHWERLNVLDDAHFCIPDVLFKRRSLHPLFPHPGMHLSNHT